MKKCEKRNIIYRQWECPSPRAVLLLVHGLGGHSNNWEYFSEYFFRNRIASYAIELKGFGENVQAYVKGHIDSLNTYVKDVRRLHYIIKKEHRGKRAFIAGESMGGLIAFMTAIKKPDLFNGLICISPGFASLLKFSMLDYIKMVSARFYRPKKQFIMPFDSEMCTQDPHCQRAIDNDPLEHRFATPKLLQSILIGQMYSKLLKHKIRMRALFLLGGKDSFVCGRTSRKIFKGLKTKDKELIQYPGMRHSLTAELGKEKVFHDALKWVEQRI
ncbi:MAG: alpha/beta fold hydrolase [Candidatus Omnitrophota bacterium]